MDSKNKYLDFYKENFGQGKYCSKSWGLASFEAGQESKQAEIDELQKRIDEALNVFKSDLSEIGKFDTIHKILKGEQK